jgi:hypothetical protein
MAQSSENAAVADRLGMVCTAPKEYRRILNSEDAHLVDDLLEAAASSDTEGLRLACRQLSEALNSVGYGDQTHRGPVPQGISVPRRTEPVYLCPLRICTRYWLPIEHPEATVPTCAASHEPLRQRVLK